MISPSISTLNALIPVILPTEKPHLNSVPLLHWRPVRCSHHRQNPNTIDKPRLPKNPLLINPIIVTPDHAPSRSSGNGKKIIEEKKGFSTVGSGQMLLLCGFGYWVQGFRCFPWLGLNIYMANNLSLNSSTLQLVQNVGNLPTVAKPLYGILSDAFYIGGAHRVPYVSIGVFLQVISWGLLAVNPTARGALPALMACILLSNIGASITEVAKDALIAEYGQKHKIGGLQSYAFMALAAGGILGSLLGGIYLLTSRAEAMFLLFSGLLSLQLAISLVTREDSLHLSQPSNQTFDRKSILRSVGEQFNNLMVAIKDESIFRPLIWIVASIAMVPIQTGSIFCYQTQFLSLNPSIIGMSRVIGQVVLLFMTIMFDRYWKKISMRKLVCMAQVLYASCLLLDLILVTQVNVKLGIPNRLFVLCFSGLAETLAQFKLLPFSVLIASLSPSGCEGSLISFSAATLCLSSIISGFWGVGLAKLIGVSSANYSRLPLGILIQATAALVPLAWICHIPTSPSLAEKERKKARSRRTRRTRRVGRVVFDSVYTYRREREFDPLR